MTFAIDFVGTNLESGTKTYNINFCNELNLINHNEKIVIFICKNYLQQIESLSKKNSTRSINAENKGSKFFSYLIVFIITFVALIILLDTLKTPLINVFPELEIILFNLFETLQDLKLFIIDLF